MEKRNKRLQIVLGLLIWSAALLAGCGKKEAPAEAEEDVWEESDEAEEGTGDYRTVIWQGSTYTYNDHLSNFLFLGVDTREKAETEVGNADAGQSDALYLLSWDRVENRFTLISIPRDTMTPIEVFDRNGDSLGVTENHISLAYGYGDGSFKSLELSKNAVSGLLYGLPIQGTCAMSLDGIPEMIKSFGDITVTVPNDSLAEKYPEFRKGAEVTITPENAEIFLRSRDTDVSQSAIDRMERQQAFLDAFGNAAAADPSKITKLYEDLMPYLVTSISNDWFVKLIDALSTDETVERWTVPGNGVEGEQFDEYHVDNTALYENIIETFYKKAE